MIVLENEIELNKKIDCIDRLIDQYSQLRLVVNDNIKQTYETIIIQLNKQKIEVKKLLNSHI